MNQGNPAAQCTVGLDTPHREAGPRLSSHRIDKPAWGLFYGLSTRGAAHANHLANIGKTGKQASLICASLRLYARHPPGSPAMSFPCDTYGIGATGKICKLGRNPPDEHISHRHGAFVRERHTPAKPGYQQVIHTDFAQTSCQFILERALLGGTFPTLLVYHTRRSPQAVSGCVALLEVQPDGQPPLDPSMGPLPQSGAPAVRMFSLGGSGKKSPDSPDNHGDAAPAHRIPRRRTSRDCKAVQFS
jgi:hypothetical protein